MNNERLSRYMFLLRKHHSLFSNRRAPFKIQTNPKKMLAWEKQHAKAVARQGKMSSNQLGVLAEDNFILVIRDLVVFPDKKANPYIRILNQGELKGGKGVAIFCVKGQKILLLKQFRHATRTWHYEIPRGFAEAGVSSKKQAIRELDEEFQGKPSFIKKLGEMHSNTGLESGSVALFFAEIASTGKPNLQEGIVSLEWITLPKFERMIRNSIITDSFTIVAFTRAKLRKFI